MTAMVVASGVLVALLILLREWLGSLGGSVAGIVFLVIVAFFYFVPTIVAAQRDIPNKNSVFIINLFFGWTFIGWVIALAMAMGQAETEETTVGQFDFSDEKPRPTPAVSDIRQCPFCAEDIKKAAVVCKHCGRDVEPIGS